MSTASIDQQFVEYVVKSLVSKPDEVKIERRIDEKGVLLELTVDPEDLGRVIGKRGATAQSLRTLLRALGTKNDARYNLKIVDNGEPRPQRSYDDRPRDDYRAAPADDSQSTTIDDNQAQDDQSSQDDNTTQQHDADTEEASEAQPITSEGLGEAQSSTSAEADSAADDHDTVMSKTRKELEELDDLDV